MLRRPWLEIGVLIAVIALVGLWAFPHRSEPSPVASARANPAGPSPRPDVQWQATWEDELVFQGSFRLWNWSTETLYAERDRFRLVESNSTTTRRVDTGTLTRRGDRLELRGMRNSRAYRIHGRTGHYVLESLEPTWPRFTQEPMAERHLRPSPDWLRPGGHLGILGISPGTAVSKVRRRFGKPVTEGPPGKPPCRLAFPLKGYYGFLFVEPDRKGRVYRVLGFKLEQDGRPLLNSRSTLADLESLLGRLPVPALTNDGEARYEWPRLGLTVVVSQIPRLTATRDDASIASIRLSPPR